MKYLSIFSPVFVMSFALCSCANNYHGESISIDYRTSLTPIYLEDYPSDLCASKVEVYDHNLEDALKIFWENRSKMPFFVLGTSNSPRTTILIASSELCDKVKFTEGDGVRFLHDVLGRVIASDPYIIKSVDTEERLRSLGLFDLIDAKPAKKSNYQMCVVEDNIGHSGNEELLIPPNMLATTRYVLGIPIVYYSKSSDKDILVFDSNCDYKSDYIKIIKYTYGL